MADRESYRREQGVKAEGKRLKRSHKHAETGGAAVAPGREPYKPEIERGEAAHSWKGALPVSFFAASGSWGRRSRPVDFCLELRLSHRTMLAAFAFLEGINSH